MHETDLRATARALLPCLDLTSLNEGDTPETLAELCRRAQSPYGNVAAVCVWPLFVRQARASLPPAINVAAVANFPAGALHTGAVLAEIDAIAQAGAQEIDVVLPWRALQAGQGSEVAEFLAEVRHASQPLTLKLILESGELQDEALIRRATQLGLAAGADFIKTSTGKTAHGASLEAATAIVDEIALSGFADAGFKASGGVRTVRQAAPYLALVRRRLGTDARLRIGASGLLDDIEALLGGSPAAPPTGSY